MTSFDQALEKEQLQRAGSHKVNMAQHYARFQARQSEADVVAVAERLKSLENDCVRGLMALQARAVLPPRNA